MRFLGEFDPPEGLDFARGARVVLQTDRGVELGDVLCPATDRTARYLENPVRGNILRPAGIDDEAKESACPPSSPGPLRPRLS